VRELVQETYAGGGRPSIDPVVFFKLQLGMFFESIRSERLLMRHAADRLSVHWYLGYDLGEPLRSVWVEPLFAEGKEWHGMRRFRLRRHWRVNCEALMRAAGQNLKRLLKKRGWGRRSWPQEAVCAVPALDREDEELQMDHASRRKRTAITIASMVSTGLTRNRLGARALLFSHTVVAQRGAPFSAQVQPLSFLLVSSALLWVSRGSCVDSIEPRGSRQVRLLFSAEEARQKSFSTGCIDYTYHPLTAHAQFLL